MLVKLIIVGKGDTCYISLVSTEYIYATVTNVLATLNHWSLGNLNEILDM